MVAESPPAVAAFLREAGSQRAAAGLRVRSRYRFPRIPSRSSGRPAPLRRRLKRSRSSPEFPPRATRRKSRPILVPPGFACHPLRIRRRPLSSFRSPHPFFLRPLPAHTRAPFPSLARRIPRKFPSRSRPSRRLLRRSRLRLLRPASALRRERPRNPDRLLSEIPAEGPSIIPYQSLQGPHG